MMCPMKLAPGTCVGPYEVVSLLGAGGMGEVYRARDPRLRRDVALKILPDSLAADDDRLRRFEVEAQAASALTHPNVVAIHDVGRHEGTPYVVSELLEGETLRERLDDGPLPPRRAVEIAAQMAQGLAAAHERGIVHRDLKPENVMLTRDGQVKILDFGLAKLFQRDAPDGEESRTFTRETDPGTVLGTVGYMSPEQVRGRPVDLRSDIFSLGAVLYEMVSGRRAFRGDSAVETLNAILKDEPPDLVDSGRPLPPGLERVVRHCLEKRPEERFQSARDLAFDLQTVSVASGSGPVAAVGAGWSPIVRTALVAAVALAALTAAFLIGRRVSYRPNPEYKLVTFKRGTIRSARFAGDGGLVYSAAWYGRPLEVFSGRTDSPDARALGLTNATVHGVTKGGELAVTFASGRPAGGGMLARVSMDGGAPRDILDDVTAADWSADGGDFAVVRNVGGRMRLEYPIGQVVHEEVAISDPRISPDGKHVAFLSHPRIGDDRGSVVIVDRRGRQTTVADGWSSAAGLAWGPDGREVWFTASRTGAENALHAVGLAGTVRLLATVPGRLTLQDVAADGRALVARHEVYSEMLAQAPGETAERDLSWHDHSRVADISADGRALLFSETGEAGGTRYGVYLRPMDGSPAVRLGDGRAVALSPDGKWALAIPLDPPARLVLLPTGAGQARTIISPDIAQYQWATFFPDGKRLLVMGNEPGSDMRLFELDLDGRKARPITPPGVGTFAHTLTPDGQRIIASDRAFTAVGIYPVAGGPPVPLTGLQPQDIPLGWSADGRVMLGRPTPGGFTVSLLDPATGTQRVVKELKPDQTGVVRVTAGVLTADGRAYAYNVLKSLSSLYVVSGLR